MSSLRRLTIAAVFAFAVAAFGTTAAAAQQFVAELPDAITRSALYERTDGGWAVSEAEIEWELEPSGNGIGATISFPGRDTAVTLAFWPHPQGGVNAASVRYYGLGIAVYIERPSDILASADQHLNQVDLFDRFGWDEWIWSETQPPLGPVPSALIYLMVVGELDDLMSITPIQTATGLRFKFVEPDQGSVVAALDLSVGDELRAYIDELIAGWLARDADPREAVLYHLSFDGGLSRGFYLVRNDTRFLAEGDSRWQLAGEGENAEITGQIAVPGRGDFVLSIGRGADGGEIVLRLWATADQSQTAFVDWTALYAKLTERDGGFLLASRLGRDLLEQPFTMVLAASPRTVDRLLQTNWFDIFLSNADGTGTLLAINKGDAGRAIFDQAFAAWGLTPGGAE